LLSLNNIGKLSIEDKLRTQKLREQKLDADLQWPLL